MEYEIILLSFGSKLAVLMKFLKYIKSIQMQMYSASI